MTKPEPSKQGFRKTLSKIAIEDILRDRMHETAHKEVLDESDVEELAKRIHTEYLNQQKSAVEWLKKEIDGCSK